jgi:hypothetical protein
MVGWLFHAHQKAVSHAEAKIKLKDTAARAMGDVRESLRRAVRVFYQEAVARDFYARMNLTGAPALLAGSLAPTGKSLTTAADVGNRLLALVQSDRKSVVANGWDYRVDVYKFHYYYLTASGPAVFGRQPLQLVAWVSVPLADVRQIGLIPGADRAAAVQFLYSEGVRYAVDLSVWNVNSAFYALDAGGGSVASPALVMPRETAGMLTQVSGGDLGGFRLFVSPNTAGLSQISAKVPLLAVASGQFPSGFEVAMTGTSGSSDVWFRIALAAKGAFKGCPSHVNETQVTVQNIW